MTFTLDHNDLSLFLTKEDRQQIEEMPMPSYTQAELVIKQWDNCFASREVNQTPEAMQTGMIFLKPYLKAKENYPELFI